MEHLYDFIIGGFSSSIRSDKTNFESYIKMALRYGYGIGQYNGLNKVFIGMLNACNFTTINQFKLMIEYGADPRYNNDQPFSIVCKYNFPDIAIFLIDEYNISINESDYNAINLVILKKLLEKGIQ